MFTKGECKMSDTIYSVRVPEEIKEKINYLVEETGLSSKEFMQELILTYEINKTKEIVPIIEQDLNELQTLTRRISSIYVNIGERINIITQETENEFQELLQQKDEKILSLKEKLVTLEEINAFYNTDVQKLKNELLDYKEAAEEKEKNYKDTIDRFEEVVESNKALIEEYKSKIDTLSGIVEEYKGYKTENQEIKNQLQQSGEKLVFIEKQNLELNDTLKKLKYEIDELKEKHSEEIINTEERLEFQCEKRILQLEKHYQDQIHKLNQEHNERIKQLLVELEKREVITKKEKSSSSKDHPNQMEMNLK